MILFTMLAGHPPMEKASSSDWWFRALKVCRHTNRRFNQQRHCSSFK